MARGLAEIVAEHNLSELILDTKEVTLTVKRGSTAAAVPQVASPPPVYAPPPPAAVVAAAPPPVIEDKAHVVTSPFVGTFYRRRTRSWG